MHPSTPPAQDELDGFLVTREVEELTRFTRRWLYDLVKKGKFPKPDVPGGTGAAHRWRRSTIKRALNDMAGSAPAMAPTVQQPASAPLPARQRKRKPPRATATV
jgi:predicted DNA-binding transcriptional regulator AlpA